MATIAKMLSKAVEDHRSGRLTEARGQYEAIIQIAPRHADALHLLGLIHHHKGNPQAAVDLIGKALAINPAAAAFHSNLGAAYQEIGELTKASSSFRRAVELNPGYFQAHFNQGNIGRLTANWLSAAKSYRRCIELDAADAPSHCFLGITLQQLKNDDEAIVCFRSAIKLTPDFALALRHLGLSLRQSGDLHQALASLQRSLQLEPNCAETYNELGSVYRDLQDNEASAAAYRRAVQIDPNLFEAVSNLGAVLNFLNETQESLRCLRKAQQLNPESAEMLGNLGSVLERTSKLEEAREVVERGLKISPQSVVCNIILAKCERREGRYDQARQRLEQLPREEIDSRWQQVTAFELGLILDRLNKPDEAFGQFTVGNQQAFSRALKHGTHPDVAAEVALAEIDALTDLFQAATNLTENDLPAAADQQTPVFLIGFPRSGTTLLEVALDHHPALQTLPEEPAVLAVKREMAHFPAGYPQSITTLTSDQAARLREVYFQLVGEHLKRQPATQLVDKMPLNTVDLGLILRLFPGARIIMAVRHPCDSCLSCFMQDFQLNGAMANFLDLERAALYYKQVMTLWQLYQQVSPHPFHLIRYEDMIDDFPAEMRRLIEFVGVRWDDSVLRYQEQARRRTKIRTPSYSQVTEPIYRQARFRWQRYTRQLEPCMANLTPFIELFGYGPLAPTALPPATAPQVLKPDSAPPSISSTGFSSINASPFSQPE